MKANSLYKTKRYFPIPGQGKMEISNKVVSVIDEDFQAFFDLISPNFSGWNENVLQADGPTAVSIDEGKVNVITGAFIVIQDDDKGKVLISNDGEGKLYLYKLEVEEKGKGLGSRILKILNDACADLDLILTLDTGKPGVANTTNEENAMRTKFYTKNNFKKIGNRTTNGISFSNKAYVDTFYENVA